MTHLLVEGLYWTLQDSPLENPAQYPSTLQPLIESQDSIGWAQLFLGRFSVRWRILHEHQLQTQGFQLNRLNSGSQWISGLIKIIWHHIHLVWQLRNQIRHGKTQAEKLEKRRQLCVAELKLYYDYKSDRILSNEVPDHIFYPSIQEHLYKESSLVELDNWLCTYRDIILQGKQTHQQPDLQPNPRQHLNHSFQGGEIHSSGVESIT